MQVPGAPDVPGSGQGFLLKKEGMESPKEALCVLVSLKPVSSRGGSESRPSPTRPADQPFLTKPVAHSCLFFSFAVAVLLSNLKLTWKFSLPPQTPRALS